MTNTKFTGFDAFDSSTINKAQLQTQFNDYVASFQVNEINPILDRMKQAKANYMNALLDLTETKEQFAKDNNKAREKKYGLLQFEGNTPNPVDINITDVRNPEAFITNHELQALKMYKKLGTGVSRV